MGKDKIISDDGIQEFELPGMCNPNGIFPCCSKSNWCGNTAKHCDCDGCINYKGSEIPGPPTPKSPKVDCVVECSTEIRGAIDTCLGSMPDFPLKIFNCVQQALGGTNKCLECACTIIK